MRALFYTASWNHNVTDPLNTSSGCSYYCRHGSGMASLLTAWNDATAPYVPRTDHQHKRLRQVSKAIDNRLAFEGYQFGVHYGEYSNGMRKTL